MITANRTLIVLFAASFAAAQTTSTLSQYGITWTFDKAYPYGRFANGDYWVVGPLSITGITPGFDGQNHGWEVNPVNPGSQGFAAIAPDFNAGLVPKLPYAAQPGQSIVKVMANLPPPHGAGDCRESVKTAAVLTVLASAPPGNGADFFRPPYVGDDKPLYRVSGLRTDILPSAYAPVANMPSLNQIQERFKRPQLDHKNGKTSTCIRPTDAMPFYGGAVAIGTGEGAARLMMNDPLPAKLPALIAYVQAGIDYYHFILNGQRWTAGNGEQPGNKILPAFAAALLDDPAMKNKVAATALYEDEHVLAGKNGIALFGHRGGTFNPHYSERSYWQVVQNGGSGNRTMADPYGYMDGGPSPGGWYQKCCTSQGFKGVALSMKLMPPLRQVWDHPLLMSYAERWVRQGAWSQPDPCAPAVSGNFDADYGVKYGPDGKGGCIPDRDPSNGTGRFPSLHGANKDLGDYRSLFIDAMWAAYWDRPLAILPAQAAGAPHPSGFPGRALADILGRTHAAGRSLPAGAYLAPGPPGAREIKWVR